MPISQSLPILKVFTRLFGRKVDIEKRNLLKNDKIQQAQDEEAKGALPSKAG